MCGIAGIVATREAAPVAREALARMASALSHRGPDAFGVYRDRRAGLAHARLSVVDVAGGQQPLANEDGSLWVVFNGEVFNHVELRRELRERGHVFRTRSDTEVIVHAFEAWGEECFGRFNGQFAVALWDARNRALTLARDGLGVRPLYVCERDGRVLFASEVKALFAADPSLPRALDPAGLDQTFTFWSVVPPQTVFQGIEELRPGHVRTYAGGTSREHPYWRLEFPGAAGGFAGTLPQAAAAVREALGNATALRALRADVPVGSYLSGGLDSALVAALAAQARGDALRTFSIRFEDAEYDETEYQRLMVRHLRSEHREVVVTRAQIAAAFPDVVAHAERPMLRTAPAPLYLLSRLVRAEGIKVVLTGEGADEFFAGYDLYREAKVRRFWAREPASPRRPRLLERLYPYLARSPVRGQPSARPFFGRDLHLWREPGFSHLPRWRSTAALKRLFSAATRQAAGGRDAVGELLASLPVEFHGWSDLAQDQYLEVRTLLTGYLLSSQGDRMLMAHSVEGRFPFLDPAVVALANSLPPRYKLRGLDEKHVLKRAAAGILPPEILRRRKQPYRAPDASCFFGPDAPDWVDDAVSDRELRDAGAFDPEVVDRLWAKCRGRPRGWSFSNTDNMAVVGILSTQLLHGRLREWGRAPCPPVPIGTMVDRVGEAAGVGVAPA